MCAAGGDRIKFGASTRTYVFQNDNGADKKEDAVATDDKVLEEHLPQSFGAKQRNEEGFSAKDALAAAREKVQCAHL